MPAISAPKPEKSLCSCPILIPFDQYFTGFLHRVEDRLFIQWYQGTKIDNLQFPAFLLVKKLGYVEAKMGRIAISDDCQIFSRTADTGFPKRNLEILGL